MQVAQETPVDSQSELVEMLSQAAELEHALCCQYLYAAFTLRQPGDPGVSQSQSTMLAQWGQQVYKVAIQEMYHLTLANDLLTAVNAKPNFWRPNFPEPKARYADIHLPSRLSAFTLETVSRFMCWEKP
ncbi:MAG: hypothetical protein JOZ41_03870, partial [Chloroflexi bacterium]|nr:hypothetical protein [Chloroflexota bacterium]